MCPRYLGCARLVGFNIIIIIIFLSSEAEFLIPNVAVLG
jgi:hypothetical protein